MEKPCCSDSDSHTSHDLCVMRVPIFNHLETEDLHKVTGTIRRVSYARGETVYRPGDVSNKLYVIHKGSLKIYRLTAGGRVQLLRILGPGDFTGELALFSPRQHDDFAQAQEATQVCTIHRDDLQGLMTRYPAIAMRLLAEVSSRLGQSEKQTLNATQPVESRIALYLAELSEDQKSLDIELPMSRKDLASYLGTSPETVSRKLTDFEESGWIAQSGRRRIRINDLDALLLT